MGQAAAGVAAALPRELHLDAMVAVGQQRVAVADHDRAERASDGRPWMQVRAVAVLGLWPNAVDTSPGAGPEASPAPAAGPAGPAPPPADATAAQAGTSSSASMICSSGAGRPSR
ncbi:hypothetical protein G6F66_014053 [Rhizopus arrhizus]|nr:hypothetical protein G6F66_014053 [Rhizopus arrhizus]